MTSRLPVELWQEIISYALVIRILPHQGAALFDDLDLFGHPCKINHFLASARASLRLVCRLWNEIVLLEGDRNYCAFTEARSRDVFDFDTVKYAHRLEFLESCESFCRKWPCKFNPRGVGRCPQVSRRSIHTKERRGQIMVRGNCPMTVQVVRLVRDIRDPTKLLQCCKNLKALSIRFASFRILDKTTVLPIVQNQLSHLHLHNIYDDGTTHSLNLPHLQYLELYLRLTRHHSDLFVFPLDIYMPGVVTIYIRGSVRNEYASSVERLLMSSKETLVNLLLCYNKQDGNQVFPLENLAQFPQLSTFGFSMLNLCPSLPENFCFHPLPNMTSLTLLLFGIRGHHQQPQWSHRRTYANRCIEMFTRPGKWFSGVSIPLEWSELEDVWVQACETYCGKDESCEDDHDPLPCYWSVLDRISQKGIPIRDRNGVGLWEAGGAKLAQRMKTLTESNRYANQGLRK
ncbi:hypothetical protein FRC19_006257 [Serendipita sp. 401]|nr:hypothetical protein FRC19_006257 [Serendipita sp. 401]